MELQDITWFGTSRALKNIKCLANRIKINFKLVGLGEMDKEILLSNINKVHTTEMGVGRIKRNLKLDTDEVVDYCKKKVLDKNCNIYKQGKNWYCEVDNMIITINSYSYTIITAHLIK